MPRLQKRPLPDESLQSPTLGLCRRWCWQIGGQSDILEQVELPLRGARDHHMDIEAWLQGLGLERYAPAFRDNEIDSEVLPKLTSEDLREIGIAAVGHRRKLMDAIAALGASAPTAAVTAVVSGASAPADAERRQLTVMFCDLVGSTPRSCGRSSPSITVPSPRPLPSWTGLSRSIWATASWSISATRELTRTMPSGRSGRGSA